MSLTSFARREFLAGLAAGAAVGGIGLPALAAPTALPLPEWRNILATHLVLANVEQAMAGQHKTLIRVTMELNRALLGWAKSVVPHRCMLAPVHLTSNGYRITARTRKLKAMLNLSIEDETLLRNDVWPEIQASLSEEFEQDFLRAQADLEAGGFVMAHYLPVLASIQVDPNTFTPTAVFRTSYGIVPTALADLPRHMVGV